MMMGMMNEDKGTLTELIELYLSGVDMTNEGARCLYQALAHPQSSCLQLTRKVLGKHQFDDDDDTAKDFLDAMNAATPTSGTGV